MTLELQATPAEVMRAVEALQQFGRARGFSEKDLFGLALALEETASNIVHHALQRDSQKTFRVRVEYSEGLFSIELRDRGPAFDPTLKRALPGEPDDPEDKTGGWGIPLVRRHTDEIHYARVKDENVLCLIKRLGERCP
jgi:anti-sigma regulatory factor (Ser/Thr protein kinase)